MKLVATEDDATDDDNDNYIDSPQNLFHMLKSNKDFQKSSKTFQRSSTDPLMGYSLQDLEAFASTRQTRENNSPLPLYLDTDKANDLVLSNDNDGDSDDALIFLDPDAYISQSSQAQEERLGLDLVDGESFSYRELDRGNDSIDSFDDFAASAPSVETSSPSSYRSAVTNFLETVPFAPSPPASLEITNGEINNSPTMDDVWNAIRQNNPNDNLLQEELHQQVLAGEEGFLNNSPTFLQSLTDTTKLDEAIVERRGRLYRERQERAMAELEAQMSEHMAMLEQQQQQQQQESQAELSISRCRQCQSLLSDDEKQAPVHDKVESINNGYLCRVCYQAVLLATSREEEKQDQYQREQRARRVMRSFRETGVVASAAMARPQGKTSSPQLSQRRIQTPSPSRQQRAVATNHTSSQPAKELLSCRIAPNSQSVSSVVAPQRLDAPRAPSFPIANNQPPVLGRTSIPNQFGNEVSSDRAEGGATNGAQLPPYPWVATEDPDTKDVFYWNEETEEMVWDLNDIVG